METWLFFVLFSSQVLSGSSKVSDEEYATMPTIFVLDNFDNCMLYGKKALYCMMTFQLKPLDPSNPPAVWNTIQEVSSNPHNYRHDWMRHGVCIPETCPEVPEGLLKNDTRALEALSECYSKKYHSRNLTGDVTAIRCETAETPYPIDNYDLYFAYFIGAYLTLVIFASLYEGTARYESKEIYDKRTGTTFGRVMTSFSIIKNWYRLKTVNWENEDVQKLRVIQGVRFYNMFLVILSHTALGNTGVPVANVQYNEKLGDSATFMFMDSGGFCVSTFFMISSFLLTYHFFRTYGDKTKVPFSFFMYATINRYIRLTPTLLLVIAFHSTWMVRMSRGPGWDVFVGQEYRRCRKNWWTNALYINTWVNPREICLFQTWYLGVDTQLFCVALLALYLMWKYRDRIPLILGGLLIICHSIPYFLKSYFYNYPLTVRPTPENMYEFKVLTLDQWQFVLNTTYANIPGLVGGLALGYIYYRYKDRQIYTKKIYVVMYWLYVWSVGLGVIVIPGLIIYAPGYKTNIFYESLFGCISRILFVSAIGTVIFTTTQGIGWAMKWICEFPPTYVLGRLSYSCYLIHSVAIRVRAGSRRTPTYVSDMVMITELIMDITISFLLALVLTLLFEMPLSALQNLIFSPNKGDPKLKNGAEKKQT